MKYIEHELSNLKTEVIDMWELVYSQLNRSGEALLSLDKELAHEVIHREKRVNAYELKIDRECEDIISLYTPVAVDLRFVISMLKINSNLERIGDFCEGMSRFVIDYPEMSLDHELLDCTSLGEMLEIIKKMILTCKRALVEENSALAVSVFEMDNRVDEINHNANRIVADYVMEFPDRALSCLNLMGIIRKMERIGDHCNNMAEETIFYLDAKVLKHSNKNNNKAD